MNHKELFEHLVNGGSIADHKGNIAKLIDGNVKFDAQHMTGMIAVLDSASAWSIHKPKVKKAFWLVSWDNGEGARYCTNMYTSEEATRGIRAREKGRQVHSIEIEVDDE